MTLLDYLRRVGKKKKEVIYPFTLDWMHADMHSHLIPGIDDGAKTMEESIALIKRLHGHGLKKIVTTPHIMSEYYKNTPEIIRSGLERVRETLKEEQIDIDIHAAAEYYMDEIFLEKVNNGEELLCIHDNLVLVETGFINKPQMLLETFFAMELKGYRPVFAHPERYHYLIQDKALQNELMDRQILFQINLLSLTGFYSKQVKQFAEFLIDQEKVAFWGTDCHNERYLDMLETLNRSSYYEKIMNAPVRNRLL
ncbi:PHP domain-containing protein [Nitritalea halalkaliphila LW7]|uniref:protein-tyrosine-phosphatase n=1 Tax=Nitritalea halalkaliphila LW7 TaxID=1189621 RepID=I5C5R5_9BACT|nr:CpsB/CapC family capsule biosynthesis tyrosine phosphatase [Nitritalea halalkaliphila]EIM77167.1 PHP domain-containing protein [Nitritalea halalkaliphila LW7]